MSLTVPAAVAVNAVMRAPVTASSFAIRVTATPPTEVNEPAMITAVPPGATTMEVISPLTFGLKAVSITPVVALNARMRFRVKVVVLPAFCAWVNVPATIIRLPTCTIASTLPLVMFGVKLTGSAETTAGWEIWNAWPTPVPRTSIAPVRARTMSRVARGRRVLTGVMARSFRPTFREEGPGHREA